MIQIRDTLLHFLADNLPGIPVHPRRFDANDPNSMVLQENAVNVEFMHFDPAVAVSSQTVAIDIIHEDEYTAVTWMTQIWNLLKSAFYTQIQDYTNPLFPVALKSHMTWDAKGVRFKRVYAEHYCHYLCLLKLDFHL